MRIETLRIQNFRSFVDEEIKFDPYNVIVGENGAGKSNILSALNILFRNSKLDNFNSISLLENDFHNKNINEPVKITATFSDLSEEAKEDFKAYVRHGKLVLSARADWDPSSRCATVQQFGQRLVFSKFTTFFEREKAGASAPELKDIFSKLRDEFAEIRKETSKAAMAEALREYEEARPELCELHESPDSFYGFTKGKNLLARYVQWIYVPAVKDAGSEQDEQKNSALGELLARTIRQKVDFSESLNELKNNMIEEYEKIVHAQAGSLGEISTSLEARLQEWVHEAVTLKLNWHFEPEKSLTVNEPWARIFVGERDFVSDVVRLGHGMQRSILISLLQELGALDDSRSAPTMVLGIEEPELYQHPPQARHFSDVLQKISQGNAQIIMTTHSPYFVGANGFSSIRRAQGQSVEIGTKVFAFSGPRLAGDIAAALEAPAHVVTAEMARVQQIMQPSQNELFFARIPIIVEGTEDVAFLATHMHETGQWSKFRALGCHFVVSDGKTNQSRLLGICNGLEIPCYSIFDSDGSKANKSDNARDNACLIRLSGEEIGDYEFPEQPHYGDRCTAWPDDIGKAVIDDLGADTWDDAETSARKMHGLESGVRRKNQVLIAATIIELKNRGKTSSVLQSAVDKIFEYSQNVSK